jgi:hypothetical protein
MNTIKMQVPTSTGFIGPSEISSGAALFKHLGNTSQSFISLLGEFGLRLQQMSSPTANGSEVSLRRMFLDLYNKSGATDTLHASIYSDKANNTNAVNSPSFSILGESTPERFYGALNEDMINPVILVPHAEWAINLVNADIAALTERFEAGEIGSNSFELRQSLEIIRVIKDYVTMPYDKIEKYLQFKSPQMHLDKAIPYIYIQRRLVAAAAFRNDRAGATVAMKRALQNLVDADRIREMGKPWASEKYKTSQRCFVINDVSILE